MSIVGGKFLTAESGGGLNGFTWRASASVLMINRLAEGAWEGLVFEDNGDDTISISCPNGQYVCAEDGGGGVLSTNRTEKRSWERFRKNDLRCADGVHFLGLTKDGLGVDARALAPSLTFRRLGGGGVPHTVTNINAGFCNRRDRHGRIMFDPAYTTLDDASRAEWRAIKHEDARTHIVLAPKFGYPGFGSVNFLRDPSGFRFFVDEVMRDNLTSLIFWSTGDGNSFADDTPSWPTLLPAFSDLQDNILSALAWEAVGQGGGWTSKQYDDGVWMVDRYLGSRAIIMFHGQPERWTAASYHGHRNEGFAPLDAIGRPCVWKVADNQPDPNEGAWLERDDPYHGDEAGMWNTETGRRIGIVGYQTPHGSKLLDPNGAGSDVGEWEDRWIEGLDRLGVGGHGWQKKPLSFYESVAMDYTRGNATEGDAKRLTARARQLAQARGIDCTWGNGA